MDSWKPVVKVFGEKDWHSNGLRFSTEAEARAYAKDLMHRWTLVEDYGAEQADEPPNSVWVTAPVAH